MRSEPAPSEDPAALQVLLAAERVENERLRKIIRELQRHRFGRRAESLPVDQLLLGLEEAEQAEAADEAETEAAAPAKRSARTGERRANRGALPKHLPWIETVVDVEDKSCPCCAAPLHRIGEDVSERLDVVPAQLRVLVVRRPKYACRACTDGVSQAPAPARLIEGGLPTDATVAQVLVSKYADHLPLYRQAQIFARQGVTLDRSTQADWVGRAAQLLAPVHGRLLDHLRASTKLFADETTAPVLDPGRGRTKTGQLWATRATTGLGAAQTRRLRPTFTRPTARRSVRSPISPASPACYRWTAMRDIASWPSATASSSPSAGRTSVESSSTSPRRAHRR